MNITQKQLQENFEEYIEAFEENEGLEYIIESEDGKLLKMISYKKYEKLFGEINAKQ
jgi:hypothetical protein